MKFSEAIRKFSAWRAFKVKTGTLKGYDKELKTFCLFLRDPDIERIAITDVVEYLNGLQALGWDANSFIPKCMALRKFFEFYRLQKYRVLDENLIPIPRKQYRIPRVVTEENYRKLLSSIPVNNSPRDTRNRAIIQLLWDSGARNGEIVSLNLSDMDYDRMRAVITTEKSRGRRPIREIFWTQETNDTLQRWVELRETLRQGDPEALFICTSSMNCGLRFTIKGVAEMLRRCSTRAKLPYVNAHSFRHHLGHELIQQGGSAADVMNVLGHASLSSSTIYTMMTDKELEGRYRLLKGA